MVLPGLVLVAGGRRLGRRVGGADQVGGGLSAAFALFGGESEQGASLVFGVAGGEGVGDPEVACDEGGGGEQRDRREAGEAAPAAGEVGGGGVGDGGEGALGGGAAVVGEAVRG